MIQNLSELRVERILRVFDAYLANVTRKVLQRNMIWRK